jgi:hypothetical protein
LNSITRLSTNSTMSPLAREIFQYLIGGILIICILFRVGQWLVGIFVK